MTPHCTRRPSIISAELFGMLRENFKTGTNLNQMNARWLWRSEYHYVQQMKIGQSQATRHPYQVSLMSLKPGLSSQTKFHQGVFSHTCNPSPVHFNLHWLLSHIWKQIRYAFTRVNSGLDGIPGRVIKSCTNQLASAFTLVFDHLLHRKTVPHLLLKKPSYCSLQEN